MALSCNFQRTSPLRIPIRLSKRTQTQQKLKKSSVVPPLAMQLLRSLNNDRRNSFTVPSNIFERTIRQDACLLDQSCMDQFDDSYALEHDAIQPLTPRKSPHLKRRDSLTHLSKKVKTSSGLIGSSGAMGLSGVGGVVSSRKRFCAIRKRMVSSMRKIVSNRRSDYSKL